MSSSRQPTKTRKRPLPGLRTPDPFDRGREVSELNSPSDEDPGRAGEATGHDNSQKRVLQLLGEALPPSDGAETASIMEHFKNAVEEAALIPGVCLPDRMAWQNTVDVLKQQAGLDEQSAANLIRQFEGILDVVNSQEVKDSLEFAERLERDGAEAASKWLEEKRAPEENGSALAKTSIENSSVVVRDKNRVRKVNRQRGPPRS